MNRSLASERTRLCVRDEFRQNEMSLITLLAAAGDYVLVPLERTDHMQKLPEAQGWEFK